MLHCEYTGRVKDMIFDSVEVHVRRKHRYRPKQVVLLYLATVVIKLPRSILNVASFQVGRIPSKCALRLQPELTFLVVE